MSLSLQTARRRRQLTVAELGAKSGVTSRTIYRLERYLTRPNHATVVALERALRVPRGALRFDGHEPLGPKPRGRAATPESRRRRRRLQRAAARLAAMAPVPDAAPVQG